jgi:hypothetical protein
LDDHWGRVRGLEGRTLKTVRGDSFRVLSVDHGGLRVAVGAHGNSNRIGRDAIEAALALPRQSGNLQPSAVRRAGINEFQPAYVAGIVNALDQERGG